MFVSWWNNKETAWARAVWKCFHRKRNCKINSKNGGKNDVKKGNSKTCCPNLSRVKSLNKTDSKFWSLHHGTISWRYFFCMTSSEMEGKVNGNSNGNVSHSVCIEVCCRSPIVSSFQNLTPQMWQVYITMLMFASVSAAISHSWFI